MTVEEIRKLLIEMTCKADNQAVAVILRTAASDIETYRAQWLMSGIFPTQSQVELMGRTVINAGRGYTSVPTASFSPIPDTIRAEYKQMLAEREMTNEPFIKSEPEVPPGLMKMNMSPESRQSNGRPSVSGPGFYAEFLTDEGLDEFLRKQAEAGKQVTSWVVKHETSWRDKPPML